MDDQELAAKLKRAERALRNNEVVDAVKKVRAIIGPKNIPNSEAEAQTALNLMRSGKTPSPAQFEALEIVVRLMRPVMLSKKGQLADLPDNKDHKLFTEDDRAAWEAFRDTVSPVIYSVGRVELGKDHKGTGFVVAANLIATNRHVLAALTSGSEVLGPATARVVFQQEGEPNDKKHIVAIDGVAAIHPKLDMVLLRLAGTGRPAVTISKDAAKDENRVVVIGYPARDEANNPLFLAGVFGGLFGVKRAALGEVLDGTDTPSLFHDCSTTQGNSGSPVFDLLTGQVVGIHRAGFFMYRNEAVDGAALAAFVRQHAS